jgi:hypothetical protein
VAWLTPGPAGAQVSADLLSAGGAARFGPGHLSLSTGFVDRSDAVAAWLGDHYLAAWRDQSNVTRTMVGRISPDGVPLDGDGIEVSIGSSGSPPVLASNGRNAVVAWLDSGGVSASFVDEGGHVFRRMFDFPGGQPSVNWNGQQYVVVWRSPQGQALGLRMNGAGALIDNDPVTIGPVDGDPVVGWTGNAYVLAFRGPVPIVPAPLPAPVAVLAQFVSAKLTPIGTPILVANSLRATPPLVSDTIGGSLIVWEDAPAGAQQLRGARVVNGALIDPVNGFAIGPGSNATVFPNSIGWGVIAGEDLYTVSLSGVVVPHPGEFPFVPAGTRAFVVLGGPEPLVLYRRPPQGGEQAMQVVGRYVIPEIRQRAARH